MTANPKPTYTQVKNQYESLREFAREVAYEQLAPVMTNKQGKAVLKSAISLDGLTFDCQRVLRKWEKTGLRSVAWDWDTVLRKYRTHPKRFELSVWYDHFLCGATIGRPSWGGGKLRLDFIEASPTRSPISGLLVDIVIIAGVAYAETIGATQIRIMEPVNEKVKSLYLSKPGFSFDKRGNFCYRDL